MTLGTLATLVSLIGTLLAIIKALYGQGKKISILMKAQQAQMRNQLLVQYHFYKDKGWISDEELEDWVNQYNSYHCLGANGILDSRKAELIALPSRAN